MTKRVVGCLAVLLGIKSILWPDQPPPDGKTVRRRLFDFLSRSRRQAPQRGRGAYLRRFIEHVQAVTRRYAPRLFHCYDDPLIPQTSNSLEGLNGTCKRNLRRCAGRMSTASGPANSYGRFYMFGVALHECIPPNELDEILLDFSLDEFHKAEAELQEVRAPAQRRRAHMRNPPKHLDDILCRWLQE